MTEKGKALTDRNWMRETDIGDVSSSLANLSSMLERWARRLPVTWKLVVVLLLCPAIIFLFILSSVVVFSFIYSYRSPSTLDCAIERRFE